MYNITKYIITKYLPDNFTEVFYKIYNNLCIFTNQKLDKIITIITEKILNDEIDINILSEDKFREPSLFADYCLEMSLLKNNYKICLHLLLNYKIEEKNLHTICKDSFKKILEVININNSSFKKLILNNKWPINLRFIYIKWRIEKNLTLNMSHIHDLYCYPIQRRMLYRLLYKNKRFKLLYNIFNKVNDEYYFEIFNWIKKYHNLPIVEIIFFRKIENVDNKVTKELTINSKEIKELIINSKEIKELIVEYGVNEMLIKCLLSTGDRSFILDIFKYYEKNGYPSNSTNYIFDYILLPELIKENEPHYMDILNKIPIKRLNKISFKELISTDRLDIVKLLIPKRDICISFKVITYAFINGKDEMYELLIKKYSTDEYFLKKLCWERKQYLLPPYYPTNVKYEERFIKLLKIIKNPYNSLLFLIRKKIPTRFLLILLKREDLDFSKCRQRYFFITFCKKYYEHINDKEFELVIKTITGRFPHFSIPFDELCNLLVTDFDKLNGIKKFLIIIKNSKKKQLPKLYIKFLSQHISQFNCKYKRYILDNNLFKSKYLFQYLELEYIKKRELEKKRREEEKKELEKKRREEEKRVLEKKRREEDKRELEKIWEDTDDYDF
jgi:hypothetical protein